MFKKFSLFSLIAAFLMFFLCACDEAHTMTDEERAARRASYISEYEVCSVMQYIKVNTNHFGGVENSELCYAFTYIGSDGALKTVDGFQNLEYGLTKVRVGDSNKYVVDTYREAIHYLYLTADTLKSVSGMKE